MILIAIIIIQQSEKYKENYLFPLELFLLKYYDRNRVCSHYSFELYHGKIVFLCLEDGVGNMMSRVTVTSMSSFCPLIPQNFDHTISLTGHYLYWQCNCYNIFLYIDN